MNIDKPSNENNKKDWSKYWERTKYREPRALTLRALMNIKHFEEALDLGAGALVETKAMLAAGFKHVTAVDGGSGFSSFATDSFNSDKVTVVENSFQSFSFLPNTYDFINASSSIFLLDRGELQVIIQKIKNALKPNGIFSANFLGESDAMANLEERAVFTDQEDVKSFLSDFEFIECSEKEGDFPDSKGEMRHLHQFRVIAKKVSQDFVA